MCGSLWLNAEATLEFRAASPVFFYNLIIAPPHRRFVSPRCLNWGTNQLVLDVALTDAPAGDGVPFCVGLAWHRQNQVFDLS